MLRTFRNGAGPYLMAGIRGFSRASSFHFFPAEILLLSRQARVRYLAVKIYRYSVKDLPIALYCRLLVAPLRASHTLNIHTRGWEISEFFNATITTF